MDTEFKQGALTEVVFFILLSTLRPCHGYAVMQNIKSLTNGRVNIGAGTMYGAINTLLAKQWISAVCHDVESRKKEYVTTEIGVHVLQNELIRLQELYAIGMNEINKKDGDNREN